MFCSWWHCSSSAVQCYAVGTTDYGSSFVRGLHIMQQNFQSWSSRQPRSMIPKVQFKNTQANYYYLDHFFGISCKLHICMGVQLLQFLWKWMDQVTIGKVSYDGISIFYLQSKFFPGPPAMQTHQFFWESCSKTRPDCLAWMRLFDCISCTFIRFTCS